MKRDVKFFEVGSAITKWWSPSDSKHWTYSAQKLPPPWKNYFQLRTFLLYVGKLMFPSMLLSPSFLPAIIQVEHSWLPPFSFLEQALYSPPPPCLALSSLMSVTSASVQITQIMALLNQGQSWRKRKPIQRICSHSPLDVLPAELNWKAWFLWILRKHTYQRKPYFETSVMIALSALVSIPVDNPVCESRP